MDIDEIVDSNMRLHSINDPQDDYFSNFALNYDKALQAQTSSSINKNIDKDTSNSVINTNQNNISELTSSFNQADDSLINKNQDKWTNFSKSFINFNSEISIKKPMTIDQVLRLLADKDSVLKSPSNYLSEFNVSASCSFKSNVNNLDFNGSSLVKSQLFHSNKTDFSREKYNTITSFNINYNNNNNSSTFVGSNQDDKSSFKTFRDKSTDYFDWLSNDKSSPKNCAIKFKNKDFNNENSIDLVKVNPFNTSINSDLKLNQLSNDKLLRDDINIRIILNHPSFRSKKEKERRSIMNL